MNPLEDFKKPLIKEFTFKNHKVKLKSLNSKEIEIIEEEAFNELSNESEKLTYNLYYQKRKIKILSKSIISIDGIKLSHFDSIKNNLKNNDVDFLIQKEIETWDNNVTDIIFSFFNSLMKEKTRIKKKIDFNSNPELRLYWKLRKNFSKEEIDSWSQIEWEWAIKNIQKDEEDKIELIKSVFNFIKPYMNLDLYKAEQENKEQEKKQLVEDNKLIQQYNTDKTQFFIGAKGGDVFSDTIEFEEETPLILEE